MRAMSTFQRNFLPHIGPLSERLRHPSVVRCCPASSSADQLRSSCEEASCSNRNSTSVIRRHILLGSVAALATITLPLPSDAQTNLYAARDLQGIEVFLRNILLKS